MRKLGTKNRNLGCVIAKFTPTRTRKIQINVKHIRPTASVPIGVKNALLVLEEVCEYTRTPSWGWAIFTQIHLQNHR